METWVRRNLWRGGAFVPGRDLGSGSWGELRPAAWPSLPELPSPLLHLVIHNHAVTSSPVGAVLMSFRATNNVSETNAKSRIHSGWSVAHVQRVSLRPGCRALGRHPGEPTFDGPQSPPSVGSVATLIVQ